MLEEGLFLKEMAKNLYSLIRLNLFKFSLSFEKHQANHKKKLQNFI